MRLVDAYMVPPAGEYDTVLPPEEEMAFQRWLKTLPPRLRSTEDYDMRGAWKHNSTQAANGHLPDTWKKPNHITFSQESIYSKPDNAGGTWSDAGAGRYAFWASPQNLANTSAPDMSQYFKQNEPDSTLVLPIKYSLPRGAQ